MTPRQPARRSPAGHPAAARLVEKVRGLLDATAQQIPSVLLSDGDPVEVLVRVDLHAVHVEVPAVEWHGHTPVLTGERRASFAAGEIESGAGRRRFEEAVAGARAERCARFRTCAECGRHLPPEWMHGRDLCQGCAERHHGIVY